jgi:hypothetical protein
MKDYARIDTSEKPDASKLFCEAFSAAMMALIFIFSLLWAAV